MNKFFFYYPFSILDFSGDIIIFLRSMLVGKRIIDIIMASEISSGLVKFFSSS